MGFVVVYKNDAERETTFVCVTSPSTILIQRDNGWCGVGDPWLIHKHLPCKSKRFPVVLKSDLGTAKLAYGKAMHKASLGRGIGAGRAE